MCTVVGAGYLGLAAFCLRVFEREARARATLSLT
jgi:hypothetical protein